MCASGSPGADSGLRPRRRSCDRSVALGATPLAPETGRGRHPLALTVNGEDRGRADRAASRTCSFVVMRRPPIGSSADAGLGLRWRAMGRSPTASRGNVAPFCGVGNHVDLRRLPGGAAGIQTDRHHGKCGGHRSGSVWVGQSFTPATLSANRLQWRNVHVDFRTRRLGSPIPSTMMARMRFSKAISSSMLCR